ncbi:MAG TPA: hypothetical protein VN647_08955 [Nitrospira sp.]|nr:hypothetical protein [Nitrospira sp.]
MTNALNQPMTEKNVTDRLLFINSLLVDLLVLPKVHRASEELTTLIGEIAQNGMAPEDPSKHAF